MIQFCVCVYLRLRFLHTIFIINISFYMKLMSIETQRAIYYDNKYDITLIEHFQNMDALGSIVSLFWIVFLLF